MEQRNRIPPSPNYVCFDPFSVCLKLQQQGLRTATCYDLSQQHEVSENMNEKQSVTRVPCDTAAHAHSTVLFTPPPPPLTWRLEVRQP